MAAREMIGVRGEALVAACLTDFCGRTEPYFHPHPLGEKCPTFDFLVELLGVGNKLAYFLVQVKATQQGYTQREANLKQKVSAWDIRKMTGCPIPTYLLGVDEPAGLVYIVSVHGKRTTAIPSIPTAHRLDCRNLKRLWVEVRDHWATLRSAVKKTSVFG
jgi:hypothetical protein